MNGIRYERERDAATFLKAALTKLGFKITVSKFDGRHGMSFTVNGKVRVTVDERLRKGMTYSRTSQRYIETWYGTGRYTARLEAGFKTRRVFDGKDGSWNVERVASRIREIAAAQKGA